MLGRKDREMEILEEDFLLLERHIKMFREMTKAFRKSLGLEIKYA